MSSSDHKTKTEARESLPVLVDELTSLTEISASATGSRKAGKVRRAMAAAVDIAIAAILTTIPIVGEIAAVAYLLLRDGVDLPLMHGRSVGKTLMRLRPESLNGGEMTLASSVKRNLPFVVGPAIALVPLLGWIFGPLIAIAIAGIEVALIFSDVDGRRIGDKLAATIVVED